MQDVAVYIASENSLYGLSQAIIVHQREDKRQGRRETRLVLNDHT